MVALQDSCVGSIRLTCLCRIAHGTLEAVVPQVRQKIFNRGGDLIPEQFPFGLQGISGFPESAFWPQNHSWLIKAEASSPYFFDMSFFNQICDH
jgi:hypothetical protein